MKIKETSEKRTKLSATQKNFLNLYFEMNPNPSIQERVYIAQQSSISEEKVRNWFQNRRAKERDDLNTPPCLSFSDVNSLKTSEPRVHPASNDLYIRR